MWIAYTSRPQLVALCGLNFMSRKAAVVGMIFGERASSTIYGPSLHVEVKLAIILLSPTSLFFSPSFLFFFPFVFVFCLENNYLSLSYPWGKSHIREKKCACEYLSRCSGMVFPSLFEFFFFKKKRTFHLRA